jgi:dUTPase|tara:strand:- start:5115 stop:5354 length:240 start_codon:yes stop_codon:yes gene_type:complete
MSNKNPYELRFDVLAMAKELADRAYDQQQQVFWTMVNQAQEHFAGEDLEKVIQKYTPKMYQPKEIMEKAEELYNFVKKQ